PGEGRPIRCTAEPGGRAPAARDGRGRRDVGRGSRASRRARLSTEAQGVRKMKLAAVLMDILAASGVRYLFGNPGTTELTFLDALPGSRLEYVVGLQEATAVSAADGYAQASGHAGIANVHVAPGVANSLSVLQNAARAKSPLVLTAGQQDSRFLLDEPILSGDLVQLTEQWTKWSCEVRRAEEAPM